MTSDHVATVHDNLRAGIVGLADLLPGGETRQFGRIAAASAGLPVPEYNRAFVFDPVPRDDLEAAVSWLRRRDLPFWTTTAAPAVEGVAGFPAEFDLAKSHEDPGMVLPSLNDVQPRARPADVSRATDDAALDEFVAVFSSVFGRSEAIATQAYRPLVPDDGAELFLGRVDGRAVACGVLSRTGPVAGVYAIGVVEEFRGRGIGECMTRAVLRAGRNAGCQIGALQSTEMARPLYEKLGFETVVTYCHFGPST